MRGEEKQKVGWGTWSCTLSRLRQSRTSIKSNLDTCQCIRRDWFRAAISSVSKRVSWDVIHRQVTLSVICFWQALLLPWSGLCVRLASQMHTSRVLQWQDFWWWLQSGRGVSWHALFGQKPIDPEEINKHLVAYGGELHAAGKSYTKYSETISSVVGLKPLLKRQMTSAWDLAFAWLIDEPHQHHPAMPMSATLSLVCVALLWGWPVEGALIALTWSGVLKIGEVLGAYRRDLFLPSELAPGCDFMLLRVPEPKTRGRGARRQSARIDPADLVLLISSVFLRYGSDQKLWPYSAATLRRKFSQLLAAVGLQTKVVGGVRPFDLGSLRPGGATWLLNQTEDSNLVQRRGRWMSYRVMTIYLQEIAVATTLPKLSPQVRKTIQELNSVFPQVLQKAVGYLSFNIPCAIRCKLFLGQPGETVWKVWGMMPFQFGASLKSGTNEQLLATERKKECPMLAHKLRNDFDASQDSRPATHCPVHLFPGWPFQFGASLKSGTNKQLLATEQKKGVPDAYIKFCKWKPAVSTSMFRHNHEVFTKSYLTDILVADTHVWVQTALCLMVPLIAVLRIWGLWGVLSCKRNLMMRAISWRLMKRLCCNTWPTHLAVST